MQNIFIPFLSYSLFSLFFFVQTILSSTPKIIQPNPISKPSHISTYITIHPNPPLHFPTEPNTRKKSHKAHLTLLLLPLNSGNAQKIANSFPPPWNGNQLDPTAHHWISHFFFLVGLKLFLVALVYLTLACQLLSTPFSIVEKKKGKKGTFPRVNVCVRVWSSAENTVLRWLRVTFHEIFARTPHVLTLVSRFVHVAPRRGLTGREN